MSVKAHDVGIAALVVGVAVGASGTASVTVFPVKPDFGFDVPGDFLVAVQA